MNVRPAGEQDHASLVDAIRKFRRSLAELRGKPQIVNRSAAELELNDYLQRGFPVYVADDGNGLAGYMVCRVDEDVVWVESIYVEESHRRQGVASQLYDEAERLAQQRGGDTPYNWVDPNNEAMIHFLGKRGYNVLNLIELRRPAPGENLVHKVNVGDHEFYRQ